MTKNLTPEQMRRRRAAAHELRERAGALLEDAARLDGYPPLWLTLDQCSVIAAHLGITASALAEAVEALCIMPDNDTKGEDR